jgi:hypothetical protein
MQSYFSDNPPSNAPNMSRDSEEDGVGTLEFIVYGSINTMLCMG